jgi:hypothetical protein
MSETKTGQRKQSEQPTEPPAGELGAKVTPAPSKAKVNITLPPLSSFDQVTHPDIVESFERPVKSKPGEVRKFSSKGPKADAVVRVIFADQGFTRQDIADIVDCSASRVTEIMWAIEATHGGTAEWTVPTIPRTSKNVEPDAK